MSASTQPAVANPYPKLFTQAQWRKLLDNDGRDGLQIVPVVLLFTPDAAATWLLTSVCRNEPDIAYGLCDLGVGFVEFGPVSLSELAAFRGFLGLSVERDRYVTLDKPVKVYLERTQGGIGHIQV